MSNSPNKAPRFVGCCELFDQIAKGGFATVYLGRWLGVAGFTKRVAIKRLHGQFAHQPRVLTMFANEARIVARINHPNVLPTVDLVQHDGELFIVMEYVDGIPLSKLLTHAKQRGERIPVGVALQIMLGVLAGLHAAHEVTDAKGAPMHIVHRDVSPDNILVRGDGLPLLLDFGVAKAVGMAATTVQGEIKGRLSYMAPEQVRGKPATRSSDIFAASILLWEMLSWSRLFKGRNAGEIVHALTTMAIPSLTSIRPEIPAELDAVVLRGLHRTPKTRWSTAAELASALKRCGQVASAENAAHWVKKVAGGYLETQAQVVRSMELTPLDDALVRRLRQTPSMEASDAGSPPSRPRAPPTPSSERSVPRAQASHPQVPPPPRSEPPASFPRSSEPELALPTAGGPSAAATNIATPCSSDAVTSMFSALPPPSSSHPAERGNADELTPLFTARGTRVEQDSAPPSANDGRTSDAPVVFNRTRDATSARARSRQARISAAAAAVLLGGALATVTISPAAKSRRPTSAATTDSLLHAEAKLVETIAQLPQRRSIKTAVVRLSATVLEVDDDAHPDAEPVARRPKRAR